VISATDVMNHACACAAGDLPLCAITTGIRWPNARAWPRFTIRRRTGGAMGLCDCSAPSRRPAVGMQRRPAPGYHRRNGRVRAPQPRHERNPTSFVLCRPPFLFPEYRATGRAFRGEKVPNDAFAVLWSGGFNTWADPDTLASGLILAMGREPRIHFVDRRRRHTGPRRPHLRAFPGANGRFSRRGALPLRGGSGPTKCRILSRIRPGRQLRETKP